jgi:hypothetical protein
VCVASLLPGLSLTDRYIISYRPYISLCGCGTSTISCRAKLERVRYTVERSDGGGLYIAAFIPIDIMKSVSYLASTFMSPTLVNNSDDALTDFFFFLSITITCVCVCVCGVAGFPIIVGNVVLHFPF